MSEKQVPSFRWTQALRRGLSNWTEPVKVDVIKDARAIISALDFNQVAQVQRIMRKEKRTDSDLTRLRDMNKEVDALMSMRSTQHNVVLRAGGLSKDELLELSADLEKLRKKVIRAEGGNPGVYQGNLTATQLNQRAELMKLVGMGPGLRSGNGVVRVWDVKDSSLMINQFGSMPALTIACMTEQGGETMNDVVQGLSALGLVYTVKFPNLDDLEKLSEQHPCLKSITQEQSQINISGYNLSLSAAVKAGACMIDGGNMLETIKMSPPMFSSIIKAVLQVKNREQMFVGSVGVQRNPYENLLYKLCLSGEGWPYIGSRSQIVGRAWDNTLIDLEGKPAVSPPPVKNGGPINLSPLSKGQEDLINQAVQKLSPKETTWIDIEGPAGDPVELAIYQPESGNYLHCYRAPHNESAFKDQSRYSHGLLLKDLKAARPGLISAIIKALPKGMVLTAQGSDDIEQLILMHGRRDIKVVDVKLTSEHARVFEDPVWDRFNPLCEKHTGLVIKKKKKGAPPSSTNPHCALMDCIMFDATVTGYIRDVKPRQLIPIDLLFKDDLNLINL
ncbi:nucleocapsid protein [Parana virus]|uniref:Nucleoprotein n=1 Tax=Parana mammarenavirus (isolate Rat/Paraguay/12056/1965) TaxID=3052323 RepID=NCAP_PARVP|nr:nucleocapsid protein [Parana virus]Q8BDE5.1 RecName: Full=Nucleoprotein; AltName: Full=Nucleocapsid protein; AltName: Full=Protein N [Mammarenavirus paranaense]AAN09945.1 nucleocapsid protein [Parana virus]